MKSIFTCLLFFISTVFYAQNISYNETTYTVKGEKIFQNNEEVTTSLTDLEKEAVLSAHKVEANKVTKELEKKEKEAIKSEKEKAKRIKAQEKKLKEVEKKQKKAEKKLKKAEKEAKKKVNAQKSLDKAENKFEKETKKFEKLKKRGKLSPVKEAKYLEKLEGLKDNVGKASKKLKKL